MKQISAQNTRWHIGLVILLLAALPAIAKDTRARDELLRLVPEDVGFCVVVQDLRDYSRKVLASPFVKQLRASALGQQLAAAPEMSRLEDADSQVQAFLNVSLTQLRGDIFGDAVVLAYRPGPPGKPEAEQGVLLVHARDPRLLARLVDRLNEVQSQSHDLEKLETRHLGEAVYYCREERQGKSYYFLRGSILAASKQEGILRETLQRALQSSTAEPALLRNLRQCGVANDIACWWINPRAFDAHLEAGAAHADESQRAFLQTVRTYWKGIDGVALSLALAEKDVQIKLSAVATPQRLPALLRSTFTDTPKSSKLWSCFPDTAILAVAGRFDAADSMKELGTFMTPEARAHMHQTLSRGLGAALGKDIEKDILPYLGPDWGICVLAPERDRHTLLPQSLTALRIRPDGKTPPLPTVLLNGLNALAGLAVFSYNANHDDPIVLKTVVHGKTEIRYLSGQAFPEGVQPAYAFKDGYLLLASAPSVIDHFQAPTHSPTRTGNDVLLLRLSLHALADYLQDHKSALATRMAEKDHVSRGEAENRMTYLIDVCRLFDRFDVLQEGASGRVTTVLRLGTRWPLLAPARRLAKPGRAGKASD